MFLSYKLSPIRTVSVRNGIRPNDETSIYMFTIYNVTDLDNVYVATIDSAASLMDNRSILVFTRYGDRCIPFMRVSMWELNNTIKLASLLRFGVEVPLQKDEILYSCVQFIGSHLALH